jgi:hypothetical protein
MRPDGGDRLLRSARSLARVPTDFGDGLVESWQMLHRPCVANDLRCRVLVVKKKPPEGGFFMPALPAA